MRPRLRRLVSWWRSISPPAPKALPESSRDTGDETERRLDDARQRLKQSVPPREDS